MKRLLFLAFIISLFGTSLYAERFILSESARLSLLTCSPGPAAYEKFGHTAVRILDESQDVDLVANWGIFDFDEPGFYFKFIKGNTYYYLGINRTDFFLESYRRRNSSVIEQVLNLSADEKQRLVDAVSENFLPENRRYLYNFVFDNCATRPKDMINGIVRPKMIGASSDIIEDKSFRDWVGEYAGKQSWLQFGIDLVFGKDADQIATTEQALFLPEVLCRAYDGAKITDENGIETPLVLEENLLVEKIEEQQKPNRFSLPIFWTLFFLVAGLLITYFENKKKKYFKMFDIVLFSMIGIAGLIVFYLMFFSIHPLVKSNFNILWCNPLNLLVVFLLLNKKADKILKRYMDGYFILLVFSFVVAVLKIQILNIAFLPIIALLLVRVLYWFKVRRRTDVFAG